MFFRSTKNNQFQLTHSKFPRMNYLRETYAKLYESYFNASNIKLALEGA